MDRNEPAFRKSDHTRQRLYQAALKLIARKGFDAATMRTIASEAGVAPGATYYYFASKEALVHEYYKKSHDDHVEILSSYLLSETDFAQRLHRTVASKIEAAQPHKNMARALYRSAADPLSPLSPFSEDSKELRLKSLAIFREVVDGAREKFSPELKVMLPEYLWMYQMGVILFWIYDDSEGSKRTFDLIEQTVPVIESALHTIQSPLAAPFRGRILKLLMSFAPDLSGSGKIGDA